MECGYVGDRLSQYTLRLISKIDHLVSLIPNHNLVLLYMDRLFQEKNISTTSAFLSYPEADAMRPGNRFERNRYKFVIFTGCSTMQHPCVLVGCSGWMNPYSAQHGLL